MSCFNDPGSYESPNQKKITTIDTFSAYDNVLTQSNPSVYTINIQNAFGGLPGGIFPSIGYPFAFDLKIKKTKQELTELKISVLDNPANELTPSVIPISIFDADFIVTSSQVYARMFDNIIPFDDNNAYGFVYNADVNNSLDVNFTVTPTPIPFPSSPTNVINYTTNAVLSYQYNGPSGNLIVVTITVNLDLLRSIFDGLFEIEYSDTMKTGKAQLKTSNNLTIKNSTFRRYNTGDGSSTIHSTVTYNEYIVLFRGTEVMTITTGRTN
jgi:hypothetical protein